MTEGRITLYNYICKHVIAIACRDKGLEWHPNAKDVQLGENRKMGRPAKNKKALHVQPVETQNNMEVEDDEDSFIIEFDEEQDSTVTINNQETIDTLIIQAEPISISNAVNQILTQLEHQNIVQETNVDKSTTAKRPRGRPPKNKATANKKPRT